MQKDERMVERFIETCLKSSSYAPKERLRSDKVTGQKQTLRKSNIYPTVLKMKKC